MLIAISQRNDKNNNGDDMDSLENNYVSYLESLGLKLLIIPNATKDVDYYFDNFKIEGIILSGGNDVSPKRYGKNMNENLKVSEFRDDTEEKMLDIALKRRLPVLGICRGMQFINVYFKGSLFQDLKSRKEDSGHVRKDHDLVILDNSLLSEIGKVKSQVNSFHNSAILKDNLSKELCAFAKTGDGVIEGIFHKTYPIAGLQWHPERTSPSPEFNKIILEAFINKRLFWKVS